MEPEVALRPKEAVQLSRLRMDLDHSVEWEDSVLVGVGNEKSPGSHQARDHGKVPTVGIHVIHAVAMSLHAPVDDMIAYTCDSRHGHDRFDPLVESRYPPTVGPAPGTPRHPDPFGIHLGSAFQVVDAAHAIPGFHSGRRIATGHPPPHVLGISPVMNTLDLTELNGIDGQANVSVPGEPDSVVMVMNLVPETDSPLFHPSMSANIEDRRKFLVLLASDRKIQVSRYVKTRAGLVVKVLHGKSLSLELARNRSLEIGPRTVGRKPEHIAETFPVFILALVPIFPVPDFPKERILDFKGFQLEVFGEHFVPFPSERQQGEQGGKSKQSEWNGFHQINSRTQRPETSTPKKNTCQNGYSASFATSSLSGGSKLA